MVEEAGINPRTREKECTRSMGPETNGALIFVRLKQAGVPDSDAARER